MWGFPCFGSVSILCTAGKPTTATPDSEGKNTDLFTYTVESGRAWARDNPQKQSAVSHRDVGLGKFRVIVVEQADRTLLKHEGDNVTIDLPRQGEICGPFPGKKLSAAGVIDMHARFNDSGPLSEELYTFAIRFKVIQSITVQPNWEMVP